MSALIHAGERVALSHYHLDDGQWRALLSSEGASLPLLSCWADRERVYVLLLEGSRPLMASTPIEDGRYLAPSPRWTSAAWGERVAYDLYGVEGMGGLADSPAIDCGGWTATWPLAERPGPAAPALPALPARPFLYPECSGLPGVFGLSFDLHRNRIRGAGPSVGGAHRGIMASVIGQTPEEAIRLIGRVTAGGFVAHPLAFVRAVEQARGALPGPGTRDARFILAEIERISVHLYDLAQTARAVDSLLFAALCDHAREAIAKACAVSGVSRRLTDMITLGDLREGLEPVPLAQMVCEIMEPRLADMLSMQDVCGARLRGIAVLERDIARNFCIGGIAGRASGRSLDLRRLEAGMRLDALRAAGEQSGDAKARHDVRLMELRDSLSLMRRIMATVGLDDDEPVPQALDEGLGFCEGARGDIWYWVRLKNGRIDAIHARDPAASLMSVMGAVLEGGAVEQVPVILRSFGLSAAGAGL